YVVDIGEGVILDRWRPALEELGNGIEPVLTLIGQQHLRHRPDAIDGRVEGDEGGIAAGDSAMPGRTVLADVAWVVVDEAARHDGSPETEKARLRARFGDAFHRTGGPAGGRGFFAKPRELALA